LGDHVKRARLLRGFVRKEAAAALGVSGETIENWETEKTVPRAELRGRIVCFLGYDPGDWTGFSAGGGV
jgi:transcriptional regulator with XRE-family HTH domain